MADEQATTTYKQVIPMDVSRLMHDPENPRLPPKIRSKGIQEEGIIDWMLHDESLLELIGAIAQVGYFPGEPLLVTPVDVTDPNTSFIIVEGNRRFTAVELILHPEKATIYKELIKEISDNARDKEALNELPVLVYPKRREILDYLGYRHVTGIKEWGAFEKAEYLYQLSKSTPYDTMSTEEQQKALARAIGSKADYVARLLTARALFELAESKDWLGALSMDRLQTQFSLLTTALSYSNIAEYVKLNPRDITLDGLGSDEFIQLLRWLYQPVDEPTSKSIIGESRNIKLLNKIVPSARAVAHLIKTGDLQGSAQQADIKNPIDGFRNHIANADINLRSAIDIAAESMGFDEYDTKSIDELDANLSELARRVRNAIRNSKS
ncbi:hypothetical protein E4631_23910 [Hymenobacter sp. UV11]|uniref:hypothetical protein n=1 Tax=Hymenobacter sp. UV11 TaxID=1849735 RepID=UPI00105F1831|nr:hypothetical protein [Hymenobacter sp. UV11]TFZ62976.1 hypothetical protein E4631_23910 [Hymenobacter sp. UV11]